MSRIPVLGLALFLGPVATAAEDICSLVALVDQTRTLGIDFVHRSGAAGDKHLPETMGAGVAWLDYDGDGWLDLYLVQSGSYPPDGARSAANHLYRNLSGKGFADVTRAAGAGDQGYGQGAVAADVDGDGAMDLYIANVGADALLRNRGNGSFVELGGEMGLAADGWSSSVALADSDGDGDLDLYLTRYLDYAVDPGLFCGDVDSGEKRYCDPNMFSGLGDLFYENRGEGRFVEATGKAGIAPAEGRGLGVVWVDLDADRRPDIYVANDLTINLLFRNLGGGEFEDVSLLSGSAVNHEGKPEAGMGVIVADLDEDGDPDLAVTNFDVETNTLYANLGEMTFEDRSVTSGFGLPSFNLLGFGIVSLDLDRDGHLDLFVANGHIFEKPQRSTVSYAQPPLILQGSIGGKFSRLECSTLWREPVVGRGLATADYDNDGDPDLALSVNAGPAKLLENRVPGGAWVGLQTVGRAGNSQGIGSFVELTWSGGVQRRWVTAGDSYQSSSDRRLLFGLPEQATVADVEIQWPDGNRTRFLSPRLNRYLVLKQPERLP